MQIRKFNPTDANFCYEIRCDAYIKIFNNELEPDIVDACINAYQPENYVKMAQKYEFFIVEENKEVIGFFTLKKKNNTTAEIPLIYLDLEYLNKGIGQKCIKYITDWISLNWKTVDNIIVDTIIPEINSGFYRKVGFNTLKEVFCFIGDKKVKALRLKKMLNL
jgi:GNAT superfamily N-acetyltransferase